MSPTLVPAASLFALATLAPVVADEPEIPMVDKSGCMVCHRGIEWIVHPDSEMMMRILAIGRARGDPAGCIVCHGGDPTVINEDLAHTAGPPWDNGEPRGFYPDPGSPWVNKHTCGRCHPKHVAMQFNSLMMTESGKIQGAVWAFGSLEGYEHRWGNYDARNPGDADSRLGTQVYRAYMQRLKTLEPEAFPHSQTTVPQAPRDQRALARHPEQAAFTYLRTQCQRCHLGVRGRQERGDYRGMGCSACHVPYGNDGLYEGKDPTIPGNEPGHMLVHRIQSTRENKITVGDTSYSGIPVATCNACHNCSKHVGTSFQGLMESGYHSSHTEDGSSRPALHGEKYVAMQTDVHYRKGMLCQDCHTSIDVHGDGFLAGTTLAQVEIECADCHGTPDAYPWELPLGFMDEFESHEERRQQSDAPDEPRGVASALPESFEPLRVGTRYDAEDGYLITARGNPFPEVVRRGNVVVVHSASGRDLELKPLKLLAAQGELSVEARTAMGDIALHMETLECYACHATWAPQEYGSHVRIDYSRGQKSFDWVLAGHKHAELGSDTDVDEGMYDAHVPGVVTTRQSYFRWEDPALGVNGEGRVSPVIPRLQLAVTVIGSRGETLLDDHLFRVRPGIEGGGADGQLAIGTGPVQPHTTGRARSCESCHQSAKALGYGIAGTPTDEAGSEPSAGDPEPHAGEASYSGKQTQFGPTAALEPDWSRFITEDGRQVQTVGHSFRRSRPLNDKERANVDRRRQCLACHQEIPTRSLAVSFNHHLAEYAGVLPASQQEHARVLRRILLIAAWAQLGAVVLLPAAALLVAAWFVMRNRRGSMRSSTPARGTPGATTQQQTG